MTKFRRLIIFAYLSYLILWTLAELGQVLFLYATHSLSIMRDIRVRPTDFVAFYLSGQVAASPLRTAIFDANTYKTFFETATNCTLGNVDIRLSHLPFMPLVMVPFSFLPIDLAHLLFEFLTTIFGLSAFYLLIKRTHSSDNSFTAILLLGILASAASWRNWLQGQIMWLDAGLLALFLTCFFDNNSPKGGLCLALSSFKPQYAIYLSLPIFFCRRYWLLFSAIITEFILALICYANYGAPALFKYAQSLNEHELTPLFTKAIAMNCLRPFLGLLFSQTDAYKISLIINLSVLCSAIIICFLAVRKNRSKESLSWLFSALILASLLFSPHAHIHDTLLLAIPALLTLPHMRRTNSLSPTLKIWKWTFYLLPIISWICFWLWLLTGTGNYVITLIIALLLFCALRQVFLQSKVTPDKSGQTPPESTFA